MIPEQSTYEARNGYSNRTKLVGTSYHASSLSFSKNPKLSAKQASMAIHQTYNGTGLHSHNSSIHSSHLKTRSPGTSQMGTITQTTSSVGPQQVLINQGGLQMHHFHPSGTLHQKNSMSMGQYDTSKVTTKKAGTRLDKRIALLP